VVEKPAAFATVLILVVIPETLAIFGFTVAILLMFGFR